MQKLDMKNFFVPLLGMLLSPFFGQSQVVRDTVIAKSGDGIFSVLRDQGMDPSKYYAGFVELNKNNLIDGSELHVGKEYLIPNAEDSFKNMGRLITIPLKEDKPIFESEMSKMALKSDKLKDAVYYLISEDQDSSEKARKFTGDITKDLAKLLLENGARVYLIATDTEKKQTDKMQVAQTYVDIVNKLFLRNSGRYQRLLMVNAKGIMNQKRLDVSIYHHDKSDDGERLAANIQSVFKKYNSNKIIVEDGTETFADKENLFLAKNILPALTMVEIGNYGDKGVNNKTLSVRPDEKALATWLGNGIFKDYADLEIED